MKRAISLLLILALSLALPGCGNEAVPAAEPESPKAAIVENADGTTPAEAEVNIKPHDPEYIASLLAKSPVELALSGEDVKIEAWEDHEEYNSVIRGMGFREFNAGFSTPSEEDIKLMGLEKLYEDMGPEFKLEQLKYNGEVFRLDFDYTDFDYQKYEQDGTPGKLVDGWIILGTKGDSPANISGFANEDFDYSGAFNHSEFFPENFDGYCEIVDYSFYNLDENELPTVFVQCTAMYYPQSGNLYNVINVFYENLLEFTTYQPSLMYQSWDDVEKFD